MDNLNKINEEPTSKVYSPDKKEEAIQQFLKTRIEVLKSTKKDILDGVNFEQIMKDADKEYQPRDLLHKQDSKDSSIITVEDESLGLRGSRFVKVNLENEDWRSTTSEPTLLVKVQTALSILIDQNPEAVMKATTKKFEKRNNIAKALWKRNWELNDSLETLKLFVFDLAKYGWAVGHTIPRLLQRDKEILDVVDTENPDNNQYKKTKITEFNDVYREKLDPFRTWFDDKANLTDKFSLNDWYFEKDYSRDDFLEEFGKYKNSEMITGGSLSESTVGLNKSTKTRKDMITVGFYENKKKDLYVMLVPKDNVVLYYSPLPNDDGKLTCWWTYWIERDPRTIYGIGLYEMIKNDKVLYDRMRNMTIDQLVLAIYPMLFYTGTPMNGETEIKLKPNKLVSKQSGTNIDQVKIQFDPRGPDGISMIKEDMDEITGITPTLQGEVGGKTLGEVLHAKDAALKRLNIPLLNIAHAIEQDSYLTLSWMNQVYSIPEMQDFIDQKELDAFILETEKTPSNVQVKKGGKVEAQFLPTIDLSLAEDKEGILIESPDRRFFQLGKDLQLSEIKWEGKISIKAKSIISPNPEIERQRKLEVFNVVSPQVQIMASLMYQHVDIKTGQAYTPEGGRDVALAMYPGIKQILDIQDEKAEDWLPNDIVELAENPDKLAEVKTAEQAQQKAQDANNPANALFLPQASVDSTNKGNVPGGTLMNNAPDTASPVVAPSSISSPVKDMMSKMLENNTKATQG